MATRTRGRHDRSKPHSCKVTLQHLEEQPPEPGSVRPFVVVHLGAGVHGEKKLPGYRRLCHRALETGIRLLRLGHSSAVAAAEVVKVLEDSPLTNAGYGSNLNENGLVECDASIMDGESHIGTGVGAVQGVKNPIMVALSMMRDIKELQNGGNNIYKSSLPTLICGPAARDYARLHDIALCDIMDGLVSQRALQEFEYWSSKTAPDMESSRNVDCEDVINDTVGVVCGDTRGFLAAATSSGGPLLSRSGRVGPAAVFGSGIAVERLTDNTYVACCATGNGEDIIVSQLASRCCMELCHSDDTDDASSALAKSLGWFRGKQYLQSYPRPYVGLVCVTARDSCVKVNYVHTTDSMIVASQCDDSKPVVSISMNPSVPGIVASGFTVR